MHRSVRSTIKHRALDFLGEHTDRAECGEPRCLVLIALCLDDDQLNFATDVTKLISNVVGLPKRELAAAAD